MPVTSAFDAAAGGKAIMPVLGVGNYNLTSDPGTTQDSSAGFQIGSIVFNTTAGALRAWQCRDATVGAAKWAFLGADYANGGTNPATEVTAFGGGAGLIAESGNIFRLASASIAAGGSGAEYVAGVFSLPGGSLDASGRGLTITAQGNFTAGTQSRARILWNPTTAVSGTIVSVGSGVAIADTLSGTLGGGWCLTASIFKYGAAGSNTQIALHQQAQVGNIITALVTPTACTAVESGAILIAVTLTAGTPANTTLNLFEINAVN